MNTVFKALCGSTRGGEKPATRGKFTPKHFTSQYLWTSLLNYFSIFLPSQFNLAVATQDLNETLSETIIIISSC